MSIAIIDYVIFPMLGLVGIILVWTTIDMARWEFRWSKEAKELAERSRKNDAKIKRILMNIRLCSEGRGAECDPVSEYPIDK